MRTAFTSCCHFGLPGQRSQPIWGVIEQQRPALLLLLGDNIYLGKKGYDPHPPHGESKLEFQRKLLIEKYDRQLEEPHFKSLLSKLGNQFLAIWDNHDFGLAGPEFREMHPDTPVFGAAVSDEFRKMSLGVFHDKLKKKSLEPGGKHAYSTHTLTDNQGLKIKFLMVDARSFQTDFVVPFRKRTLLGFDQEEWLLAELRKNDAYMHVICSGIPYSSKTGFTWTDYPEWMKKFKEVILTVNRPLFLGGNIHSNELAGHIFREVTVEKPHLPPHHGHVFDPPDTDIEAPDVTITLNRMFEAVSSGVGHPYNYDSHTAQEMETDDGPANPEIPSNLSCNNYGLIDITSAEVIIQLYGTKAKDNHLLIINKESWTLKEYKTMNAGTLTMDTDTRYASEITSPQA